MTTRTTGADAFFPQQPRHSGIAAVLHAADTVNTEMRRLAVAERDIHVLDELDRLDAQDRKETE